MAKNKTEIHVTTVFDGELDATDVFVSLISQKYGKTNTKEYLAKKKDLCAKAGISPASVTKMGRNGHVTTEILLKICTALGCGVEDIMEIVPDSSENT